MHTPSTTSQTVGPFFKIGLEYLCVASTCTEDVPGEHILVRGVLYDGAGVPVPDAQLELWQADARGRFSGLDTGAGVPDRGFFGFARVAVIEGGHFAFRTVKPGSIAAAKSPGEAPHISVLIFMRGILKHLYTRIYFAGEQLNDTDPTLQAVPKDQRATLIAQPVEGKQGEFVWNIHLQGENETAFFTY